MEQQPPKFTDADGAAALIRQLGDVFAVVENPAYVVPRYDLYALATARALLDEGLSAVVMDMDGTTTTTENLCTEALNTMVARMARRDGGPRDQALHLEEDYPHIVGNSTTRHVEYLVRRYGATFDPEAMCVHFIASVAWTIARGLDPRRAQEGRDALRAQGLESVLKAPEFDHLCDATRSHDIPEQTRLLDILAQRNLSRLQATKVSDQTRIGIEIYYQHYHWLLRQLEEKPQEDGQGERPLIEPMPGASVALALLKGWLGRDAGALAELVAAPLRAAGTITNEGVDHSAERLSRLGAYFAAHPVKLALVTSSIAAEADIVLREVFRVIASEIDDWPLPGATRERLIDSFADPDRVYNARITANDSSEIRLKPHRDLYALALHTLGITPDAFHRVAGFEDSESGTIAIRAAGIPISCALPFAMTVNHRFEAATHVCPGGLPEVMLVKQFFLPESLLAHGSDRI